MQMPIGSRKTGRKRSAVFSEDVDALRRCWNLVHADIRFDCAFSQSTGL
jgi:hypothetical protein